ncbi:hypothetical protein CYMTET_41201 [Cymbomonas tetramitiformis]|uniref:RING-type domain-containing protein n=1 Tax=Cymbomonas tetramitiformis TaxID=36881 RepID=A0AAE0F2V9_9CHLO|nr:hypothetical protein CYMTET_41202 [Cymbomonas tetramitiformis]KAK3249367.1 hypothetical protein CYMTET_41201 [Cymbomonas tetramitiformis]
MVLAAIIGAGRMGCAIGGQLALKGATVRLYDHTEFTRQRAIQVARGMLQELVEQGNILPEDKQQAILRLSASATHGVDIVFEAVPEDLRLKREVFEAVDKACSSSSTIIATNSINYMVEDFAGGTSHRVCGVRFLHPVFLIDLVEVSGRSVEAVDASKSLLEGIGMQPFVYGRDNFGERRKLYQDEVQAIYAAHQASAKSRAHTLASTGATTSLMTSGQSFVQGKECVICCSRESNAILYPCGHVETCVACGETLQTSQQPMCPVCRRLIERIVKVDAC